MHIRRIHHDRIPYRQPDTHVELLARDHTRHSLKKTQKIKYQIMCRPKEWGNMHRQMVKEHFFDRWTRRSLHQPGILTKYQSNNNA